MRDEGAPPFAPTVADRLAEALTTAELARLYGLLSALLESSARHDDDRPAPRAEAAS